jgi:hypothetical protein
MKNIDKIIKDFIEGKKDKIKFNGIEIFPVLHGQMEWGAVVRNKFLTDPPNVCGIELPETLNKHKNSYYKVLPNTGVIRYFTKNNNKFHLIIENTDPLWEGLRSSKDMDIPCFFIDRDTEDYPENTDPYPESIALSSVDYKTYLREVMKHWNLKNMQIKYDMSEEDEEHTEEFFRYLKEDKLREETMAYHLLELEQKYKSKVLCICGIHHVFGILQALNKNAVRPFGKTRREDVEFFGVEEESSRSVCEEPGFVRNFYENWRTGEDRKIPAKYEILSKLYLQSSHDYEEDMKFKIHLSAMKKSLQYARNLALIKGGIFPSVYDIVISASSMVDHDYGHFVFQNLTKPIKSTDYFKLLDKIELSLEDLGKNSKFIKFHRKLKQNRRRMLSLVRTRPKEKIPGEWKNASDEDFICSYQPEDIVIESYGSHLKDKGKRIFGDLGNRVLPFTDSILDGLDLRETLRRWHEKRIYVQENFHSRGKVGAVVVIFDQDDDPKNEKYTYKMHWMGEHDQESDMAFYATSPGEKMVGPGISRCEYGGFLMTYPPMRMWPVWEDPQLKYFSKKADVLLGAALELTLESLVVYVAEKPPSSLLKRLAGRMNIKIIYMPIGTLPPDTLKKISHFHILANKNARKYAPLYILE